MSLGGEEGTKLLRKLGLLEVAIDYAMESGAFAQAFELTRAGAKAKLPEVRGRELCVPVSACVSADVCVHVCLRPEVQRQSCQR